MDKRDIAVDANLEDNPTATGPDANSVLTDQALDLLDKPAHAGMVRGKITDRTRKDDSNGSPTVLVFGFEPFRGQSINASWEAAKQLDGQTIDGAKVVARKLPISYGSAWSTVKEAIKETHPQLVVLTGESPIASGLTIENVAVNRDDPAPDKDGVSRHGTIIAGGPDVYGSTLPVAKTVKALQDAGISAGPSQDAGNFLCNHEFYLLENYIATAAPDLKGGFVHVPLLPEQVAYGHGPATMPLKTEVDGLKIVIATGLKAKKSDNPERLPPIDSAQV